MALLVTFRAVRELLALVPRRLRLPLALGAVVAWWVTRD